MAYEIRGHNFHYTFPKTFDLNEFQSRHQIAQKEVAGKDGARRDSRADRRLPTELTISGKLQKATVAAALSSLDELNESVRSMPDGSWLTDTLSNRRIKVSLSRVVEMRLPSRILDTSVVFNAIEDPYWQDLANTFVSQSTTQWVDLTLGNAPSNPRMNILGNTSHPTIVKGNFNLAVYVASTLAFGINTDNNFGTVRGNSNVNSNIRASKYGFGRFMTNSSLTFPMLCRTDKFSTVVRFTGNITPAADTYLFDASDAASATSSRYYLKFQVLSGGNTVKYEFGHTLSTLAGQGNSWAKDTDYQVGVWVDTTAATIKARLFQGQTVIASTATFTQASANTLTKLWIGTQNNNTSYSKQIHDEQYLWHQKMGDSYLEGFMLAQETVKPDNKVFRWSSSIPAGDILDVEHEKGRVTLFDTSAVSTSQELSSFTGEFFQLGEDVIGTERKETIFSSQAITTRWNYTKRWA